MTSTGKLKRKVLSIEEKGTIIERLETGDSNRIIANELNVAHSTISTIWKNRIKIKEAFNSNTLQRKRLRASKHEDIDSVLLRWCTMQQSKGILINGPVLQEKANQFGRLFGKTDYQCSDSWIKRFCVRHNIVLGKMSGKAASVPEEVTQNWLKTVWLKLQKKYQEEAIYNAKETGLLYRMGPDKILEFKGDKCIGDNISKERITLLVACNMNGSDKRKLLVIGKPQKSVCLKNMASLPVKYESNKKAWITSKIFIKTLQEWDNELVKFKKKILLLVDNCPAHPNIVNLKNIKLIILPPNTTCILQPLHQGIIKALKVHYRKLHILKLIQHLDENNSLDTFSLNLIDAITMITKAWDRVSSNTISHCFKHAGFIKLEAEDDFYDKGDNMQLVEWIKKYNFEDEDEVPLVEWIQNVGALSLLPNKNFMDFVNIDEDLVTSEDLNEEEIVNEIVNVGEVSVSDDVDQENDTFQIPSTADALRAINIIRGFFTYNDSNANERNMIHVSSLEREIELMFYNSVKSKPTKRSDFSVKN